MVVMLQPLEPPTSSTDDNNETVGYDHFLTPGQEALLLNSNERLGPLAYLK